MAGSIKLTLHSEPRTLLHSQAGSSQPGRGHLGPALSLGGRVWPMTDMKGCGPEWVCKWVVTTKPLIICDSRARLAEQQTVDGSYDQRKWSMDVAPL